MNRSFRLLLLTALVATACPPTRPVCGEEGQPACSEAWLILPTAELTPDYVSVVVRASDGFAIGETVSPAGDIDGDGLHDLLVVMTDIGDSSQGEVLVFLGTDLAEGGEIGPEGAHARLSGVGLQVTSAGDVDDDHLADVLVGGPDAWYLFAGSTLVAGGDFGALDAAATFTGNDGRALLGAAAGDIDGDRIDDVAISQLRDKESGRDNEEVYVFFGGALTGSRVVSDGQGAYGAVVDGNGPTSITVFGDYDQDGLADVATGATRNFAAIHSGASVGGSATLADREVHAHDCHPDDASCPNGVRVAAAGDVDGDGRDDLLVTSYPDVGAWVVLGRELSRNTYNAGCCGVRQVERTLLAGAAHLAGTGDIDADGCADLLATDGDGGAWLISGAAVQAASDPSVGVLDIEEATHPITGFSDLGVTVFGVGDIDGDGRPDVAIGTPDASAGAGVGALHLVFMPETPAPDEPRTP